MKLSISTCAFKFSAENFIKQAKSGLYMWTFTFPEVLHPKEAMRRWHTFTTRITRQWPLIGGVRVMEWHPGRDFVCFQGEIETASHGVHIHLLTDMRLSVDVVRTLSKGIFGRIHVIECKDLSEPARLANYLAKYLSKFMGNRPVSLKGARLWSNWGSWSDTKCKDVCYESGFTNFYTRLKWFCEYGNRYECEIWESPFFLAFEGFYKYWQLTQDKKDLFRALQTAKLFYKSLTREQFEGLDYFFQKQTRKYFPEKETQAF